MPSQTWPRGLKSFHLPIYGGRCYVITSKRQFEQCEAFLCKDECPPLYSGAARMYERAETGDVVYLIGIFNRDASVIAHELAHLTFFILARAGVNLELGIDKANEAFCYLLGFLVEQTNLLLLKETIK